MKQQRDRLWVLYQRLGNNISSAVTGTPSDGDVDEVIATWNALFDVMMVRYRLLREHEIAAVKALTA